MTHDSSSNSTRVPIACTLTAEAADRQALEWAELRDRASAVTSVVGGARMTFPSSMADDVEDLARRERACCAFLTITTTVSADELTLQVTSDDLDALQLINDLAGLVLP